MADPPGPDVMCPATGPADPARAVLRRSRGVRDVGGVSSGICLAGLVLGALAGSPARAAAILSAEKTPSSAARPIAGIVRAAGRPVAGVTVLLRTAGSAAAAGASAFLPVLSAITGADGTFVVPDAAPGAYALLALVPGFLPAVKGIVHEGSANRPDFVTVDLETHSRERILPPEPLVGSDPWGARVLLSGDPLRERGPDSIPAGDESRLLPVPALPAAPGHAGEPAPAAASGASLAAATPAGAVRPVRATVESLTGFGATGTAPRSRAALDVSGLLGERVRWGVEGAYDRLAANSGGATGDGQRFAVEIGAAPVPGRAASSDSLALLRIATRRQSLPLDPGSGEESRYAAHSVDATLPTGSSSAATVSARVVSQSNFGVDPRADSLFARDSRAVEVLARYTSSASDGRFVRVSVAWRSDSPREGAIASTVPSPAAGGAASAAAFQEARFGGTAGLNLLDGLSLEGSLIGEIGTRSRGVVPELLVSVLPSRSVRLYGAASQRFEQAVDPYATPWGWTGGEEDLVRLSRGILRGGVRLDSPSGDGLTVEAARRQMGASFRYLLDPDFFDRVDAVYFFPGDVVTEGSASAIFRLGEGLQGRLSGRGGRISGTGDAAGLIPANEGSFGRGEAAVHVSATGTDISVGYRVVFQTLSRGSGSDVRNDISAVDVTLAQTVPFPFLAVLGTQWRVLFSFEAGTRREADGQIASNRRLAGGLGLSF